MHDRTSRKIIQSQHNQWQAFVNMIMDTPVRKTRNFLTSQMTVSFSKWIACVAVEVNDSQVPQRIYICVKMMHLVTAGRCFVFLPYSYQLNIIGYNKFTNSCVWEQNTNIYKHKILWVIPTSSCLLFATQATIWIAHFKKRKKLSNKFRGSHLYMQSTPLERKMPEVTSGDYPYEGFEYSHLEICLQKPPLCEHNLLLFLSTFHEDSAVWYAIAFQGKCAVYI